MRASAQMLELFGMGVPVQQIRGITGLDADTTATILTRSGQRPRTTPSVTYLARVCPFFDSCRDCTFPGCALDKFREVTV